MAGKKPEVTIQQEFSRLNGLMAEMSEKLSSVEKAVKGDPALGQAGVIPRLEQLEDRAAKADQVRVASEKRESYEMGRHAVVSAAVAMIVAGIIAFTAAFIGGRSQQSAPVYVVQGGAQLPDNAVPAKTLTPGR